MRIAVVGVGGVGSAACRYLAEAGHTVVGYERFAIGHDRGSSHGESRIIRYAYPDALYTRLMGLAYPLWDDLQAQVGRDLFVRCGSVFIGPRAHSEMQETEAALVANDVPCQWYEREAATERFPTIALREDEALLYQADGGFLRASEVVQANADLARTSGATLRENALVESITPGKNGETLVCLTTGETNAFDRVIVTAGAWLGQLFVSVNLPLQVTRQQVTYLGFGPETNPDLWTPERMPVWIDLTTYWYGFPSDGRIPGVKLALHMPGEPFTPDSPERNVTESDTTAAIAYATGRFPSLAPTVTHAQVCLYTNTPTEDFIIDVAPDMPNVLLVSACSGHGFKFTALTGKFAADWAITGTLPPETSQFALK